MRVKSAPESIKYDAEFTIEDFHQSNAMVKGIRGPEGSGKTVGCFMDLFKYACLQEPYRGVRSTKWAVIRGTYPELLGTSLKTFEEWFGGWCVEIKRQPPVEARMRMLWNDGTTIEMLMLFLALDVPSDVKKLKGLEVTGSYINEATEVGRWVVTRAFGRRGRYPPKRWGVKPYWSGVIMDTNSCDNDHWWYKAAEEDLPQGWEFFNQPPALLKFTDQKSVSDYLDKRPQLSPELRRVVKDAAGALYVGNPAAENLKHQPLGINYWLDTIPGRPVNEITTLVLNEYGLTSDDRPVYPEYMDNVHCSKVELRPIRDVGITLGFDFGLTPACTFSQISPIGQKLAFDELYIKEHGAMGIRQLSREVLVPYLLDKFLPWLQKKLIDGWGDPAGNMRAQTDEKTCYQILRECPTTCTKRGSVDYNANAKKLLEPEWVDHLKKLAKEGKVSLGDLGVESRPARTNKFLTRKDAVSRLLIARIDGEPALLVSPKCKMLRKGMAGKYRYKRVQVSGEDRFKDVPVKDIYSHINEALMYDCMMSSFFAYDTTEEDQERQQAVRDKLDAPSRAAVDEYAHIVRQIKESQEAMDVWM